MSIFDALTGKIGHFNSITVPVYNEISRNIQKMCSGIEESFFGIVALEGVTQRMIDLFFKPGPNSLIGTVKKYNQNDMRHLYSIFMIWTLHDLLNSEVGQKDGLESKLKNILNLEDNKFNYYFKNLKHGREVPIGLEKLWKELILIIHDLPDAQENYLIFRREFSEKQNQALKVLSSLNQ
ncbi:MAG: hypothetical protein CEN87_518 [Parcubacteria group bacterium Licking1014_1]|nr:MAG: hypothetical protein CEN87_518 [Parcubacteria group bacterium Licking1014_1]